MCVLFCEFLAPGFFVLRPSCLREGDCHYIRVYFHVPLTKWIIKLMFWYITCGLVYTLGLGYVFLSTYVSMFSILNKSQSENENHNLSGANRYKSNL